MNKNAWIFLSVCAVLALNWACTLGVLIAAMALRSTPTTATLSTSEPAVAVVFTAGPTNTSGPTATPLPPTATFTPVPTSTNIPTITPVPRVETQPCEQIIADTNGMTDIAWDKYKRDIQGTWITAWPGEVTDVEGYTVTSGGYPVHVDVAGGCRIYAVIASKEQAMSYKRGQQVTVTGQVESLMDIFGKVLYLENATTVIAP